MRLNWKLNGQTKPVNRIIKVNKSVFSYVPSEVIFADADTTDGEADFFIPSFDGKEPIIIIIHTSSEDLYYTVLSVFYPERGLSSFTTYKVQNMYYKTAEETDSTKNKKTSL